MTENRQNTHQNSLNVDQIILFYNSTKQRKAANPDSGGEIFSRFVYKIT